MLAQPLTSEPLPASQRPADALDDIAAALPDPGRPAAAGGAGGRARRRRFTLGRLPLWAVPAAIFLTLAGLTVALWHAEVSLERLHIDTVHFTAHASNWILFGGLLGAALTAGFVYFAMRQRNADFEQTRRYLQALESLQAVSSKIIGQIETAGGDALAELCESGRKLLRMDRAGIQLLHAKPARLELLAWAGDMPDDPPRFYPLDQMPNIRQCFESGQVFAAEDVSRLDRPLNTELLSYFRVGSMLLIPLSVQGEQIGMMTLSRSAPGRVDDTDRRLAELLGSQAAVVLANSRLYQAQQDALRQYKALVDQRELLFSTNAAIYQTGGLDESLRRVAELAPLALGVDLCVVALSSRPPNNVRIAAITPGVKPRSIRPGTTFFCPAAERAFQRGAICVSAKAAEDPDVALVREAFPEMGSMACVPLTGREGARIGVLNLIRRKEGVFSAEQLKMARLFATRAAAAIENARLHQETLRSLDEQRKLLAQRDALWSVNAAVYRAGTLEESLDRIVRLAPAALGVDLCAVDLVTERPNEVYLAAITHDLGREMVGRRFDVGGMNAGRALETREPLVVEDARKDPGVKPEFRARFRIGSIAFVPLLRNDGEPIGLLVLVRHEPGPFDKVRLELARVFATRAASAIENAQLLDQTRRDADTKAMLLRELNHRVKNNLAGIVALLSMGRPDMPAAAGRWLDRVTDRVRLMAGAHQLFVGDAGSVPLDGLVERTLSSLSVARAPGVDMRVELGTRRVNIPPEQAISLAMALHELCYNAIVHGLGGRAGAVTLRTRGAGEGRLAVDVIDTGAAGGADTTGGAATFWAGNGHGGGHGDTNGNGGGPKGTGRGTGIGLELVRGLVSRELHGSFSLKAGEGGGTVATVEFPLQGIHPERETT